MTRLKQIDDLCAVILANANDLALHERGRVGANKLRDIVTAATDIRALVAEIAATEPDDDFSLAEIAKRLPLPSVDFAKHREGQTDLDNILASIRRILEEEE